MHQERFSSFDYKSDRVDKFLGQFIEKDKRFAVLWTVYVFICVCVSSCSKSDRMWISYQQGNAG